MTPQLMQAIKLLQLSSLDLAAYVEAELEKNPLLERADPPPGEEPQSPERAQSADDGDAGDDEGAGESVRTESIRESGGDEPDAAARPSASDAAAYSEWANVGGGSAAGGDYNLEAFISADMKFHTQIAAISGNPIYVAVSEAMLGWLKEYHTEMLIWTGKEQFTLTEHKEIIGRIEKKDADGAEKAMIKHLERSRALYVMNSEK